MGAFVLTFAANVILAIVVFSRGPDKVISSNQQAKWVLRVALVLMGIYAAFWLYFGIGEMISGDFSGVIHLGPAAMVMVLMYLVTRRPVEGGVALVLLGVLVSGYYFMAVAADGVWALQAQAALIGGVPYLVFGVLLLIAAALGRRKQ